MKLKRQTPDTSTSSSSSSQRVELGAAQEHEQEDVESEAQEDQREYVRRGSNMSNEREPVPLPRVELGAPETGGATMEREFRCQKEDEMGDASEVERLNVSGRLVVKDFEGRAGGGLCSRGKATRQSGIQAHPRHQLLSDATHSPPHMAVLCVLCGEKSASPARWPAQPMRCEMTE